MTAAWPPDEKPACDACKSRARWSICSFGDDIGDARVTGFACGRHLSSNLTSHGLDDGEAVLVYDIGGPVAW